MKIFRYIMLFLFKNKIAYLQLIVCPIQPDYDYSEDLSEFDERVGEGQGVFRWFTDKTFTKSWFYDNNFNPEYLFYNDKLYRYGKKGYRKSTLNQLKSL